MILFPDYGVVHLMHRMFVVYSVKNKFFLMASVLLKQSKVSYMAYFLSNMPMQINA